MSENINFSNNFTFTKVTDTDISEVVFDITDSNGLIISVPLAGLNPTLTVSGDLDITGDLNVAGSTIVNSDTKLSITDKNVLMNVPEEPKQPQGTSTLGDGSPTATDAVETAVLTESGVGFAPSSSIPVTFEAPPSGTTAEGTVTTDGSGNIYAGDPVTITVEGSGYVTAPSFTVGTIANTPPRPAVTPDGSGSIVVRDWFDGTEGHAGIIWDENEFAWDLNASINQDVYQSSPSGPLNTLSSNPRLRNIGTPVDPSDAVDFATLTGWTLGDLFDVDASGAAAGKVLRYDSGWVASDILITDIGGITVPATSSGYFFWDHTANGGAGEFVFVETISVGDITGLANVATSGTLDSLLDVVSGAATDGQILVWDEDAIGPASGAWVPGNKVEVGDLDTIQDSSVSPTSVVSTTGGSVSITTTVGNFNTTIAGTSYHDVTGNLTLDSDGILKLVSANPIVIDTGAGTSGEIKAQGDLTLSSDTGDIYIHDVSYPDASGGVADGSILVYLAGALVWSTPTSATSQPRIENTIGTTYVDTEDQNDIVVIKAPDVGDTSIGGGTVSNDVGIILNPGVGRDVLIDGASASHITSDTGLEIETTAGDISITPAGLLKLNDYIFPDDGLARNEGDVLIIDPLDNNKNNLIFSSINLGLNSDVTITGSPVEFEILINNGSGQFVNRRLQYSDIDPTGIPIPSLSVLELTDTYDPTGLVPSVPDEIRDKYLRWNEDGTQVVYESIINASSLNMVGVITNVEPDTTNTKDIGSATKKFKDIYVGTVIADTLTGSYTNGVETITESMLTADVQTKLNDTGSGGDALLSGNQTFTGINSFAPIDANGTFGVSTNAGDINLTTLSGDINITTNSGDVNITGYMKSLIVPLLHTDVVGGTGTYVKNLGDLLPDNTVIASTRILVTTPFNGTTPTVAIGTLLTADGLMAVDENDLTAASLNHVHNFYDVGSSASNKQLAATLTLNGATLGSARIMIEYYIV